MKAHDGEHEAWIVDCKQATAEACGKYGSVKMSKGDAEAIAYLLLNGLTGISKDLKLCPNCGGIVPELRVEYDGKDFWFTCYKIVDSKTQKTTFETDYEKFGRYARTLPKV
jgi:hypothetical protein